MLYTCPLLFALNGDLLPTMKWSLSYSNMTPSLLNSKLISTVPNKKLRNKQILSERRSNGSLGTWCMLNYDPIAKQPWHGEFLFVGMTSQLMRTHGNHLMSSNPSFLILTLRTRLLLRRRVMMSPKSI